MSPFTFSPALPPASTEMRRQRAKRDKAGFRKEEDT